MPVILSRKKPPLSQLVITKEEYVSSILLREESLPYVKAL
jgi:hypothetical protein